MDIDLLSKIVKELILDNDRVVLPGLGAFVAEMMPATFSDRGYTINPPYRKLYFRSRLDEGDELVRFYAASNNIEFEIADKIIREFISELKAVLYSRRMVVFPGLGRLRATKENAVFFIADEDLDIYPEGLGLESISLKTHQETKEEVGTAIAELKTMVDEMLAAEPETAVVEAAPAAEEAPETEEAEEPEAAVVISPEPADSTPGAGRKVLRIFLTIVLIAAVLLLLYVAVSRVFPHLLDSILYTPEELEILNR